MNDLSKSKSATKYNTLLLQKINNQKTGSKLPVFWLFRIHSCLIKLYGEDFGDTVDAHSDTV